MKMNYYLILGVGEKADKEVIKKAYRRLVKECHPDTHPGDKKAEERFKQISEAYAVLSDEEKRKKYDMKRASGAGYKSKSSAEQKARRQPFSTGDLQSSFGHNPIDTSALFEKYMGFK